MVDVDAVHRAFGQLAGAAAGAVCRQACERIPSIELYAVTLQHYNKGSAMLKYGLFGVVAVLVVAGVFVVWSYFHTPSITLVGFPPISIPGFHTWPTPRTFDGPGSIFVIDDGVFSNHGTLNFPVEDAGDETFTNYNGNTKWSGSVLSQMIGIFDEKLASELALDVSVMLLGTHRWRINKDDAKKSSRGVGAGTQGFGCLCNH